MAACPTMATDREYLGPAPLAQAYRYNIDSRDDAGDARRDLVAAATAFLAATMPGMFQCMPQGC